NFYQSMFRLNDGPRSPCGAISSDDIRFFVMGWCEVAPIGQTIRRRDQAWLYWCQAASRDEEATSAWPNLTHSGACRLCDRRSTSVVPISPWDSDDRSRVRRARGLDPSLQYRHPQARFVLKKLIVRSQASFAAAS